MVFEQQVFVLSGSVCFPGILCNSEMKSVNGVCLVAVLCFGMFISSLCQDDSDNVTAIYIVTLKEAHASVHYYDEMRWENHGAKYGPSERLRIPKPRYLYFYFILFPSLYIF